jgi:alkylation response protein AidB-like acyl-CoA dehydrogenase
VNIELTSEDRLFQEEVRTFLREKFTPELRDATARQAGVFAEGELARRWHSALHEQGWIAPSWPKNYGGTGWTPMQRYIYDRECGLVGTPVLPAMGLQMCGPVIIGYGTEAQKDYFLPRILSGEHYWCQGYSEPGSGSDLASLNTRAVRSGAEYVVSGTKIWTTHAHNANWMFLLARTRNTGRPQQGMSFLLTPMDVPGLTVTPIISMSGEHEVNQVFLDNVRIPVGNRVGEENDGWTVAKYLLEFERGGGVAAGRLGAHLRAACAIARRELGEDGQPLWDDPGIRTRIAEIETEVMAIEWTELRQAAARSCGQSVGNATASMIKLIVSETMQSITELAMDLLGPRAMVNQQRAIGMFSKELPIGPPHARTPTARYLNARAATIYGGSSEIQRNIVAKIALNL